MSFILYRITLHKVLVTLRGCCIVDIRPKHILKVSFDYNINFSRPIVLKFLHRIRQCHCRALYKFQNNWVTAYKVMGKRDFTKLKCVLYSYAFGTTTLVSIETLINPAGRDIFAQGPSLGVVNTANWVRYRCWHFICNIFGEKLATQRCLYKRFYPQERCIWRGKCDANYCGELNKKLW